MFKGQLLESPSSTMRAIQQYTLPYRSVSRLQLCLTVNGCRAAEKNKTPVSADNF